MTVFILEHGATPPSFNSYRTEHWRTAQRVKKQWQETFEGLLMAARVPRGIFSGCEVTAELRFRTDRRRDAGNFQTTIEKSLGDALANGGWLVDDTHDRFRFAGVVFLPKGAPLLRVRLEFDTAAAATDRASRQQVDAFSQAADFIEREFKK